MTQAGSRGPLLRSAALFFCLRRGKGVQRGMTYI